jgi:GDP-D-mannose dehydratase
MFPLLDTLLDKQSSNLKPSKIDGIEECHGSNMTLCLNNGTNKRITLRLHMGDLLVKSVLKALKVVVPPKIYEALYQDYIEVLIKSNIDAKEGDHLGKLQMLLYAIMSGDHAALGFMAGKSPQKPATTPT